MDAPLAAQLENLDELHERLIELVRPLDEDHLNWKPPAADANSIAALVRHTIGSIGMWCSRAIDEPFERDRDAEFRSHDTAATLVPALEASRARLREYFDRLAAIDLGTGRVVRRLGRSAEEPTTAAWCVSHAAVHAGEHWRQVQLTRDLFDTGS